MRSVEALFDLALSSETEEFAKVVTEEESENICEVLWALAHYSSGNESRETHCKKLMEAVESKLGKEQASARLPASLLALRSEPKIDQKTLSDALRKRGNTRNKKTQSYDLKEEATEGYCKLWAFLLHEMNRKGPKATVQYIQSCIGTYSLYPHRCVDLLLTAWEYHTSQSGDPACIAAVIKDLSVDVVELLGFRYLHHHIEKSVLPQWAKVPSIQQVMKDINGTDITFYESTPASLHTVAGHLLKEGLVYYSDLIPYLQPTLDVLQKEAEDYITKKLNVVEHLSGIDKKGLDNEYYSCKPPNCYKFNDHYGLILGTIRCGALDVAVSLLDGFKDLQPMTYPPLVNGLLCELQKRMAVISKMTQDGDKTEETIQAVLTGIEELTPLFCHLGHHLSKNLQLFSAIMNSLQFCCPVTPDTPEQESDDDEDVDMGDDTSQVEDRVRALIIKLGTESFMPAVSVMTGVERTDRKEGDQLDSVAAAPPALTHGMWKLIKCLPFKSRFAMYKNVNALLESNDFELQWASAKLTEATTRVLRRLTHDNTGEQAKKLAKLSQTSPLVLFSTIFRHVMNYGMDIIPAIVDAIKSFAPLSLDVMSYKMIALMSDTSKSRLKEDKVNLDDWLSNIGHFTALFYKKNALKYDIRPMLQYMLWHAQMGHPHELVVLSVMLKAANIDDSEDLNEFQTKVLASGSYARLECGHLYDQGKAANQRNTARLCKVLKKEMKLNNIATKLALSLAKLHSRVVFTFDSEMEHGRSGINLRMVKQQQQCINSLLAQIIQFVKLTLLEAADSSPDSAVFQFKAAELIEKEGVIPSVAQLMTRHHAPKPLLVSEAQGIEQMYGEGIEYVKKLLPEALKANADMYLAFWSLDLKDVCKAEEVYDKLTKELKTKIDEEERKLDTKRDKRELAANKKLLSGLEVEKKKQEKSVAQTLAKLKSNGKEIVGAFAEEEGREDKLLAFLQACIWPRVILCAEDACYAAKFISCLAPLGFPVFPFYLQLCKAIPRLVSSCTEIEVRRVGIFIQQVLVDWLAAVEGKTGSSKEELAEGHAALARGLVRIMGRTSHPHEQKQAFELLRALQTHFPMHKPVLQRIEEAVKPLLENEALKAPATSYTGILSRRVQQKSAAHYNVSDEVLTAYLDDKPPPKKEVVEGPVKKDKDDRKDKGKSAKYDKKDPAGGGKRERDSTGDDYRAKREKRGNSPGRGRHSRDH